VPAGRPFGRSPVSHDRHAYGRRMGRIIVEQIITADGFVQDADGGM
jgi:hypothetical protein